MANLAKTAYLGVRDGSLSNAVRLVEFRQRKVGVHTFLGWSKAGLLRRPLYRNYQSHNFFVLGPILMKFQIRARLIDSFPSTFRFWCCAKEKLHFTPFHTLRPLKRDEALFPPLGRVVEFRARYRQIPVRGFGGRQNLETVRPTVEEL